MYIFLTFYHHLQITRSIYVIRLDLKLDHFCRDCFFHFLYGYFPAVLFYYDPARTIMMIYTH